MNEKIDTDICRTPYCRKLVRWEEGDHCTKFGYTFLDFEGYDVCYDCEEYEPRSV